MAVPFKNHFFQLSTAAKGTPGNQFNRGRNDNSRERGTIAKSMDHAEMAVRFKNDLLQLRTGLKGSGVNHFNRGRDFNPRKRCKLRKSID
jgi:hypothetical protein